jgi:hypothetical protein
MAPNEQNPFIGLVDIEKGVQNFARQFVEVFEKVNRLREHLYIPVKKKNRKQIEADAVPNRHAAIHGLVVYRTAKNYTLRI